MPLDLLTLLNAVFESTADGILVVDNEGKLIRSNRKFQEMWRIPDSLIETGDDEELVSVVLDQVLDPAQFLSRVQSLYQDHDAISDDTISFKDGRIFTRHSRPLKSGNAKVGRLWVFRDMTNEMKSEEVFSAIAELSPDIISIISPEGILKYNSQAAERIHGFPREELIGKATFDYFHPEDRELCLHAMKALSENPSQIVTVQYRYRNIRGEYDWMEATASNLANSPAINGFVVISREIGARKKLEDELSTALKTKDDFISIITHELKTPVTSIKLQLQILQRAGKNLKHNGETSRSESFPALIGQVNSLDRLIDDLLQVSRIRNGKLRFDMNRENLSELLKSSDGSFRNLLDLGGCEFTSSFEDDVFILCDRMRIEQVLVNLISNVVKYAPGQPVKLALRKSGEHAEIRLIDRGPGIPEDKQIEIFKLFSRGQDFHHAGGLGVGLYISKSIIDQHQGTLDVRSKSGKGSEFIIRLPLHS